MVSLLFAALLSSPFWRVVYSQPEPLYLPYGNTSVGPDGPWWALPQAVDYPDEYMTLLPSLSNNSLIVNASACQSQSAVCVSPTPTLWTQSGADQVAQNNKTVSTPEAPSSWDPVYTALLRLTGLGSFFSERMTLHPTTGGNYILDYLVMGISNSYAVTYPGGAEYTLTAGFFSLFGGVPTFSWPDVNGFVWHNNRSLPDAYVNGYIPSNSYGLHVGSVSTNVSASLVLGGYDNSRCISTPVTSNSQSFTLTGIALNVTSGNDAYNNSNALPITNLLRANGSAVNSLTVIPDPGVPYLYLPQDTCDAIASHLPVTYDSDYNLYMWNTSTDRYTNILSSPHYISFSFSGSGSSTATINIPFTLLNLTMTWPLVSQGATKQYFPCSPWTPGSTAGYYLGRSFLQGAFLAQNWNSSTMWMAQAPGPGGVQSPSPKSIQSGDTTITPLAQPPTWDSTWPSLKPLSGNAGHADSGSSGNGNSNGSGSGNTKKSLSAGAIAGIVVGIVVLGAILAGLALWFVRRRRRNASRGYDIPLESDVRPHYAGADTQGQQYFDSPGKGQMEKGQGRGYGYGGTAPVEAPADSQIPPAELPGHETQELDGGQTAFKK